MKKLTLRILLFWILLPLKSEAINQEINKPSEEAKSHFEQLSNEFTKIRSQNFNNPYSSEYKVSHDNIETILYIIANIKTEDINKPISYLDTTFLKTCISETSRFAPADAEKITQKLLEKGADIDYNPQVPWYDSYIVHEAPLWQAALQGNVGAYKAMINHAQQNHLARQYGDKELKLSDVLFFGLKKLETIENHYKSELQKIKKGERKGYSYIYLGTINGRCVQYNEDTVLENLTRVIKLKNQFQKIQIMYAQDYSESMNKPEEESLINKFLEERIQTFDEYKRAKISEIIDCNDYIAQKPYLNNFGIEFK